MYVLIKMNDPVYHRFRHLMYTTRVPFDESLNVSLSGWVNKKSAVPYGVVLLDEFRNEPDIKEFNYENVNGDRIRFVSGRLSWKPNVRYMAVAFLATGSDLTFSADRSWKKVVTWPLEAYEPDSFDFKILSLQYQKLAAHCDNNQKLLDRIVHTIEETQIEYAQEWLRLNYVPTKPSLKEIIDHEFVRFVTCFDTTQLEQWMNDPTKCLHWTSTYDYKTNCAMFKRSTKISGKNVRRCVNVKELLYQFFIENLGEYKALYVDFDKCVHRSKCVNPHHFIVARRQSLNNSAKRRKLIDEHATN